MPQARVYEYTTVDATGKRQKGRIEASSEQAVAGRLRTMGVAPLEIREVANTGLNREISFGNSEKVSLKELAVMARQLATMISASLSLVRALSILAEQTESKALAKVVAQLRADVEVGTSFSEALAEHPRVFPPLMINMVKAGEVGGFLDDTLISVANNLEKDVALRGKIKSAMTYPVVVFCVAILASTGMLLFIVPIFGDMFSSLGGTLPLPTLILVKLSDFLKIAIIPIVILLIIFAVWWGKNKNKKSIRERVDPFKLKLPVFGNLFKKIAVARFTRNLGTMLAAGVPVLQALDIVGETSGNLVIEQASRNVMESVRTGQSIAAPLANEPVFPPMVVQMMAVGEDTGALDTMLGKVADFYDQEVESTTEQLTSLIEPLMIVFIGAIIGGMVIAMYLPIFKVFDLVQ